MPFEPEIQFIKECATEHLEQFTEKARTLKGEEQWRCLYAMLDPEITKESSSKNIAMTFLKTTFSKDADEVAAFWLYSGHLFIFFQGPVRAVIKDYESFLDFVSDGERPDYHFFWALQEFWGYFDQVLTDAIEDKPSLEAPKTKPTKTEALTIAEDLRRQRQSRYKPLLLIVEDDRVTRHMLQAAMEKYCDITIAWNAQQAREFYQTRLPNITFLDIELPDGDGQELAELFCSHDTESFVVMVSGALDNEKTARCIKAGVKGTIAKPAQEAQLLKFIDQYNKAKQQKPALG